MDSKCADLSNAAGNTLSIIPHGVRVETSISLGRDVIGWRQSKSRHEILHQNVVLWFFARANNGILPSDDPACDTTQTEHNLVMMRVQQERNFHRMAMVHDLWRCGRAAKT